jgi:hypothetical protein
LDNKPKPVTRLTMAKPKATNEATVMDMMTTSSDGAACVRSNQAIMMLSWAEAHAKPTTAHKINKNIKDTCPDLPLA